MTNEKRNHAIEWITRELGFLRRAPALNGCEMKKEWAEQIEVFEAALEALNDHVREDTKMVPLTLDQLREMDGRPVWIVEYPDWGHWELSEDAEDYISDRTTELYGLRYDDQDGKYGLHKLGWLAYAYPPAHIDWEAWTAEWIYPENEFNLPRCSRCGCNSKDAQYGHKDNFCPRCGRPMNSEALAELKHRMGVCT